MFAWRMPSWYNIGMRKLNYCWLGKFRTKLNRLWLFLACILLAAFSGKVYATESESDWGRDTEIDPYRILCISTYNYSYSTVPDQLNGLADGLDGLSVDIDYEFMDAKNYYKAADFSAFHDYLSYKIAQSDPFDLVVLFDDTALHFGMNYYDELFAGLPVVFSSVNNQVDAETAAARKNVTGITQSLDFGANIELARELFPRRSHIILIVDNTSTAQGEYTEFQKYVAEQEGEATPDVTVINASNYSKSGLERAISEINQSDSLILYLCCMEDGEGHIYTLKTGTALITRNAPDVPVWRLTLADMENGVFGGIAYSYYDASVRTGEMVAQILTGTDPNEIPMEINAAKHAYFDQNQLDKFSVRVNQLPDDATILNERQTLRSFYRQNVLLANLIMLSILLMIAIIVILVIVNRQRSRLIHQDFLTKMPNRPYIASRVEALAEARVPFGIIMMDVDYYKEINDTMGHYVGDLLLVDIGARLKAFPGKDIVFARIGGDEFMGLIFNADRNKAEFFCRQLIEVMGNDFVLSSGKIHITVSVGAAVYPEDTDDPNILTNYADAALYEVKKNGRNGYRLFQPEYLKNIGKK